jgi:TRAP transporter T-component
LPQHSPTRCRFPQCRNIAGALTAALVLSACSPQALLVRSAADSLAAQGQSPEDDLELAREASAFYLKLSESVLQKTPGHLPLAGAVAGGFTQYAYAFVAFDADRIEATDTRAAKRLRERAARLYLRAHRHAMAALEARTPGLGRWLAAAEPAPAPRLADDEIAVAYWAAASWGGHIALSTDSPEAVADLPAAMRLARLAWEREPGHAQGALATLMGTFEMARPGGTAQRAQAYFDQAFAASQGRSAGPLVAQAESIALSIGDRPGFETLLQRALGVAATHRDLPNAVMAQRAQWLLDTADVRF